jgi:hypothetical protein
MTAEASPHHQVSTWRRSFAGLGLLLSLSGCAGAAGATLLGAGGGVAMGTGVDYTLNGIAYKTFTAPLPRVRTATLRGLDRMGIQVTKDVKSNDGWTIEANARDRIIDIDLQRLTSQTTRIRVVANDGIFFKDRSTESEIIFQVADSLDAMEAKTKTAERIPRPLARPEQAAKEE